MKQLFTFLIAICAIANVFASDFGVDGLYYNITSSTAPHTIEVSVYVGDATDVLIPGNVTIDGITYSVTSIGESAFEGSRLTSITIPESITSIERHAFFGCSGLTSVVWNAKNCANPAGVMAPFCDSQITLFTFGNEVEHIPARLCEGMSRLTSIIIPNSVTSIGSRAFSGCTGLVSISIPENVTSIGGSAFSGCTGLASVTIPENVTSIGVGAFSGCTGLTSITIPENVTSIENNTFSDCTGLVSVTIPNSVTSIGVGAFSGCTGLTSITIPENVTSIEKYTFSGCTGLASVIWNAKKYPNPSSSSDAPFYNIRSQITSFTFGNEVEHIPAYLCEGMSKQVSISIPENVTSIGGSAFFGCTKLASVIWNAKKYPNPLSSSDAPFYNIRSQITSFTFGNEVEYIPAYLCEGMSKQVSISIPENVTGIGKRAFYYCSGLTSIVWNAKNCSNPSSSSDAPFHSIRSQITSFTFGNEVEHIPAYLCRDMSGLTFVTIPNSVTSIGELAFYYCSNLPSITIPNSVTSIGKYAFKGCAAITAITWNAKHCEDVLVSENAPFYDIRTQITSFTFGNDVEYMPAFLCFNMSELTSITIPNSVTAIGKGAFAYTPISTITIPRNVKEFGLAMFYRCDNLTSIIVEEGNSVFDSRNDCNAIVETATNTLVAGCSKSTFLNGITGLRPYAFYGCNGLKSVTLPSSITTIGDYAFSDCEQLSEIRCAAKLPPRIVGEDGNIMSGGAQLVSDYNAVTLYVPCESQAAYYTNANWGLFNTIECMDENKYAISVTCNADEGTIVGAGTYTEGTEVTITAIPNKGYEFIQWSDGNTDNPRKIVVTGDVNLVALFAKENTAIDDAVSNQPEVSKTIRNGQVCILRDGKVYDIMGNQIQ